LPLADIDARRAYDRARGRARYQREREPRYCVICLAVLADGRSKLCGSDSCRRKYKTLKQRDYNQPGYIKKYTLSPEALARRRERDQARNKLRSGKRNSWEWNLWHVHSVRPEQWHALFEEQSGLCYLCQRPLPGDRKKIVIDHDHSHCGKQKSCGVCRRGLACGNCNTLIGLAAEDPQRLRVIADNLERQKEITRALIMAAPEQGTLFNDVA